MTAQDKTKATLDELAAIIAGHRAAQASARSRPHANMNGAGTGMSVPIMRRIAAVRP